MHNGIKKSMINWVNKYKAGERFYVENFRSKFDISTRYADVLLESMQSDLGIIKAMFEISCVECFKTVDIIEKEAELPKTYTCDVCEALGKPMATWEPDGFDLNHVYVKQP